MVEKIYEITKGISIKFEFDKVNLDSLKDVETMARTSRQVIESIQKALGHSLINVSKVKTSAQKRNRVTTSSLIKFITSRGGSATNEEIMDNFKCSKSNYSVSLFYLKSKGTLSIENDRIKMN
jgi:hypothetical protein